MTRLLLAFALLAAGCSDLAGECREARCWDASTTSAVGGGGGAGGMGGGGMGGQGGGGAPSACGDGRRDPGELCFADPAVSHGTTKTEAVDLALADCDGDGDLDAIVAHRMGSALVALQNNGAGALEGVVITGNLAGNPIQLAAGQLVGDAAKDVALVYESAPYVDIYEGQPSCAFQLGLAEFWNMMASGWTDAVAGRFDASAGDGLAVVGDDLGLRRFGQNGLLLTPYAASPLSIAAADLDGGGIDDVVYADDGVLDTIRWQLGTGTGFNGSAGNNVEVPAGPVAVALADMDGDTDPDVVTANADDTVSVLRNSGTPSFTLLVPDAAIGGGAVNAHTPIAVATGDVDGDGDADVVTANADDTGGESSVSLLLNEGDGKLALAPGFPMAVPRAPHAVAVGDLNGDQALDIVTASSFVDGMTSYVGVLLQSP
jgi:VCBS repeat protein